MPFDRKSITPEEAWKLSIKERRHLVADLVEYESELAFDMSAWFDVDDWAVAAGLPADRIRENPNVCGTTACIAGTVAWFLEPVKAAEHLCNEDSAHWVPAVAWDFMDLTPSQRTVLFTDPDVPGLGLHMITKPVAVQCLRTLAETGEIDWRTAFLENGGRVAELWESAE